MENKLTNFLQMSDLKITKDYVGGLVKSVHQKNISIEEWNTVLLQIQHILTQVSQAYEGFVIVNDILAPFESAEAARERAVATAVNNANTAADSAYAAAASIDKQAIVDAVLANFVDTSEVAL